MFITSILDTVCECVCGVSECELSVGVWECVCVWVSEWACVCMSEWVCECMCVWCEWVLVECGCVRVCVCVWVCKSEWVYVCVWVSERVCVCMSEWACEWVWVCVCECGCVWVWVSECVCVCLSECVWLTKFGNIHTSIYSVLAITSCCEFMLGYEQNMTRRTTRNLVQNVWLVEHCTSTLTGAFFIYIKLIRI